MERKNEPNRGFLSPPGGKLHTDVAESPHQCAVREANEECGIVSDVNDWKMIGIVTEKNYPGIGNLMIFLFEYDKRLNTIPIDSIEGRFVFVPPEKIGTSNIPDTDKLFIWNFVLKDTRDLFCININCDLNPFISKIEQN